MPVRTLLAAGVAALTLSATVAQAEMAAFPYHGPNFCPAGLQPVVIGGVICCGTPNQHITWNQMMRHPAPRRHVQAPVYYGNEGIKGTGG